MVVFDFSGLFISCIDDQIERSHLNDWLIDQYSVHFYQFGQTGVIYKMFECNIIIRIENHKT